MMLFYLVAYLFGNMGAFMVVEAVARSEGSEGIDAYKGSRSGRRCWRWRC
jgi:NADH:ubiquinone oxidoreductase subunit 2 (subunit N)